MIAPMATARVFITLLLASLAAGCANTEKISGQPSVKQKAERAKAPGLSKQRLVLSEGYSMLYQDAGSLDVAELILYVKVESQAVHEIVSAASEVGGQLKKELERIAKDYPG